MWFILFAVFQVYRMSRYGFLAYWSVKTILMLSTWEVKRYRQIWFGFERPVLTTDVQTCLLLYVVLHCN